MSNETRPKRFRSPGGHRLWVAVLCAAGCAACAENVRAEKVTRHPKDERVDARAIGADATGAPLAARNINDPLNDPRVRCTDVGADGCVCISDPDGDSCVDSTPHNLPNLRRIEIGTWMPDNAALSVFDGVHDPAGLFFRLALVLEGFNNPPGPVNMIEDFSMPFLYGDHPVFGFVELDMDNNMNTGGELGFAELRYLANIARFGGLPSSRFALALRTAQNGNEANAVLGPVNRSGEEFHVALFGGAISQIAFLRGNNDEVFEAGEAWEMTGEFLHRAHGYDSLGLGPFLCNPPNAPDGRGGGGAFGAYVPTSQLRFDHDIDLNLTVVELVFPLTNEGAALMLGLATGDAECLNADAFDQASVLEALDDLQFSGDYLNSNSNGDPEEILIIEWANQNPLNYLDPTQWDITVALGTHEPNPSSPGRSFVWTDMHPNAEWGDFNADMVSNIADMQMLGQFIASFDGDPVDEDGSVNGSVRIRNFASNFSIFDVTYDGFVDEADLSAISTPGDLNLDGAVNLSDFSIFARCFGTSITNPPPSCSAIESRRSDLDNNAAVNLADFAIFASNFGG